MNDTDLWIEAQDLTDEDNANLQSIGWELFDLYTIAYCGDTNDIDKQKIVDDDTWGIYDDIWNGMTLEECINKRKGE